MLTYIMSQLRNQKGQGMVEYGLIVAFIAVVALVGVKALGLNVQSFLNGISFN